MTRGIADQVYEQGYADRIFNLYGPTEATVYATATEVERDDAEIPIGRPISNTQVYVLDRDLRPAPIGVTGELFIAGDGLARGYIGRPDHTAERFLPNPYGAGDRLYRTGDLACWRADGSLLFRGRADRETKLNGYRIHLGEIEAALLMHPSVSEAAVVVREDGEGTRSLSAFVVRAAESEAEAGDLRAHLSQFLPRHLIPAGIVEMESLPRTSNGKLDRRSLPMPQSDVITAGVHIEPQSQVERVLAEIWQQLLELPRIGLGDNFFALGGHSLMAVRMISEIRRRLGRRVALAKIFQTETLGDLARVVEENDQVEHWTQIVSMATPDPNSNSASLSFIHAAGGTVQCYQELIKNLRHPGPISAVQQLSAFSDSAERPSSIEDLASIYLKELESQNYGSPDVLIGWSFGGLIAYEMASQRAREGNPPESLVLLDTFMPDGRSRAQERSRAGWLEDFVLSLLPNLDRSRPKVLKRVIGDGTRSFEEMFSDLMSENFFDEPIEIRDLVPAYRQYEQNVSLANQYEPSNYSGRITLIQATAKPARVRSLQERALRRLVGDSLEIVEFNADHYGMIRKPAVADLAALLERSLDRTRTQ